MRAEILDLRALRGYPGEGYHTNVIYMMHDLVDWGTPLRPTEWSTAGERIIARLPLDLAAALRSRARFDGVSVGVLVRRLVESGLSQHQTLGAPRPDLTVNLFD